MGHPWFEVVRPSAMQVSRLRSTKRPRCFARDDGRLVVESAASFPTLTAKSAVRMGHPARLGWGAQAGGGDWY